MTTARRKGLDLSLITGFFFLLVLPPVWQAVRSETRPNRENRKLAAVPTFEGSVGRYLSSISAYLKDNFGFRQNLILLHNAAELRVFHRSPTSNVVIGRHGWLFFGGDRVPEYTRRARVLSPDEIERWGHAVESRQTYVESRGLQYLLVIVPNKAEIYPEQLPGWMTPNPDRPASATQILAALGERHVHALDLRFSLKAAKEEGKAVFPKTNTHWTTLGAMIGAREILRALGRSEAALAPGLYQMDRIEPEFGDLSWMMGADSIEAGVPMIEPKRGWRSTRHPLPFSAFKDDQIDRFELVNPDGRGTLLLLCDSFSVKMAPFLGESFARVVVIREMRALKEGIALYHPDIVVDERVERVLGWENPDSFRPENTH